MDIGVREIAEITGGAIVGLLTIVWRNLNGEIKAAKAVAEAALPRADFLEQMERLEQGRREFREVQIGMQVRIEAHIREDAIRFELLTKDFNGGMSRIVETINKNHTEFLREMNTKEDRR